MKRTILTFIFIIMLISTVNASVPNIVEYKKPECRLWEEVDNNCVIRCYVYLRNDGDTYAHFITEMQIRPAGELPLAFVGEWETCDEDNPYAVHSEVSLSPGEAVKFELEPLAYVPCPGGKIPDRIPQDVYLITVDKCWAEPPQGNTAYPPYYRGKLVARCVGDTCHPVEGGTFIGGGDDYGLLLMLGLVGVVGVVLFLILSYIIMRWR